MVWGDAQARKCEQLAVAGVGRCKGEVEAIEEVLGEMIRQDMSHLDLTEDMTLDRRSWRSRIRVEG